MKSGIKNMLTAQDMIDASGNIASIMNIFNNNVILTNYHKDRNLKGVHPMGVAPFQNANPWTAKNQLDRSVDIMDICNRSGYASTFDAYWCPFEMNDCKSVFCGDAASYMFTAKMDGCTFAIGSNTGQGVNVAHANMGGKGSAQYDQLKAKNKFKNDGAMKYLGPAAYRYTAVNGGTEATTFGIRTAPGKWSFYSQVVYWDKIAKKMNVIEIKYLG